MVASMQGFAILMGLVYIGIVIFFFNLAIRFVKAIESMSFTIRNIADKFESK